MPSKSKPLKKPSCGSKSKPIIRTIYFDNNATTKICPAASKAVHKCISYFNPSSDNKLAQPAKQLLTKAKNSLLAHCNVNSATHIPIFTSGASESNCLIIRSCVEAFRRKLSDRGIDEKPHIILSAIEHKASMLCANNLVESGIAEVSFVPVTIFGNVLVDKVEQEIRPNTCLISIMYANNELPTINNIQAIAKMARQNQIPVHSDAVQIFGKYKIDLAKNPISAISGSAHKFYGPKGVGFLIIEKALVDGYQLCGQIGGTQQGGLRGGTENIHGIAGLMTSLKDTFKQRKSKTTKLMKLRETFLSLISNHYPLLEYVDFVKRQNTTTESKDEIPDIELVSLGPPSAQKTFILPNTILLSICKHRGIPFCNVKLRKFLNQKNIIVSIGSACSTQSTKSSHVLEAIGAPSVVKRGVLRISFGDHNTMQEIKYAIPIIVEGIKKQCRDIM